MPNANRFPRRGHDHGACIDRSLTRARTAYREQGSRLTELRELVLKELAATHKPQGAYALIGKLAKRGRSVAPISVYRALDSLSEAGLIHRLESRNAYVACHATHGGEKPILFLFCEKCGSVAEADAPDLARAVGATTAEAHFAANRYVLEAQGLCADCGG